MDGYEDEVREMERARVNGNVPRCPVVFYGSSSFRLWNTLEEDLGARDVVNAAFGGSTLAACAHYYRRLVGSLHPRSLVVYAGDNDLGNGSRPREVLESFRALIAQVSDIPFGFLSIKVSPARFGLVERIRETNSLIQEELRRRPKAFFMDISRAMLNAEGQPRPELFTEDGLHLSRTGYEVWAHTLREYRNRIFTRDCEDVNEDEVSFSKDEPGISQMVQSPSEA